MKTVTVALEDLEALVFATGAIKTIEGVLASRKEDPFVKPFLAMTDAHNRCAAAMRDVKRAEAGTLIKYDEPLTKEERDTLEEIASGDIPGISVGAKLPQKGEAMSVYDRLAAKGCVVLGQRVHGVIWGGEDKPSLAIDPNEYAIRITERGRKRLLSSPDEHSG